MDSSDSIGFLTNTILGLKSALFAAENQSKQSQKAILSLVVKKTAFENKFLELQVKCIEMKNAFEKETDHLKSEVVNLKNLLCDKEKDFINSEFLVKELRAYIDEKRNLWESSSTKETKAEKQTNNRTSRETKLIQAIKNILIKHNDLEAVKEIAKRMKRYEQITARKTDASNTGPELNSDAISQMSDISTLVRPPSRLFSRSNTPMSDVRPFSNHFKQHFDDTESTCAISYMSDVDSDYDSTGIKSVESVLSDKSTSLPAESEKSPFSPVGSLPDTSDANTAAAEDATKRVEPEEALENDAENLLIEKNPKADAICDEYFDEKILESVVDRVLSEMSYLRELASQIAVFKDFLASQDPVVGADRSKPSLFDLVELSAPTGKRDIDNGRSTKRKIDAIESGEVKKKKCEKLVENREKIANEEAPQVVADILTDSSPSDGQNSADTVPKEDDVVEVTIRDEKLAALDETESNEANIEETANDEPAKLPVNLISEEAAQANVAKKDESVTERKCDCKSREESKLQESTNEVESKAQFVETASRVNETSADNGEKVVRAECDVDVATIIETFVALHDKVTQGERSFAEFCAKAEPQRVCCVNERNGGDETVSEQTPGDIVEEDDRERNVDDESRAELPSVTKDDEDDDYNNLIIVEEENFTVENISTDEAADERKLAARSHRDGDGVRDRNRAATNSTSPRYNLRRYAMMNNHAKQESTNNGKRDDERICDASDAQKPVLPKFYVEQESMADTPVVAYRSPLDEIWNQIREMPMDRSSRPSAAVDLVKVTQSIIHSAIELKNKSAECKNSEKVVKFRAMYKVFATFMAEKQRNFATAFTVFNSSLMDSNRKTIGSVMVELILETAKESGIKQNNTIAELFSIAISVEKNMFANFVEVLLETLKIRMYSKEWDLSSGVNGYVMSCTILLGRLYIRLCKWLGNTDAVLKLVHESLMLFRYKCQPIAYSVMLEWPEVFHKIKTKHLLTRILMFTLVHHKMKYNMEIYKAHEVKEKLQEYYGVKLGVKAPEDYAKELMFQLNDTSWVDAVVLLCKRQMFSWAYSNVIMKYMIPILDKWNREDFEEAIVFKILLALKEIMLAYPVKEDGKGIFNVEVILNTLKNVLNNDKGSRELKELVVLTLCNISAIKFDSCSDLVLAWKPKDDLIGGGTLEQLSALLKRKALLTKWLHRVNPKKYGAYCEQNRRMTTRNSSNVMKKEDSHTNRGAARFVAGKMKTSSETASFPTKTVPPCTKKKKKKKRKRN